MTQHFDLSFVQEIENHGKDQPSLGSIISWSVRDIFIERADIQQLLTKHDLTHIDLPEITELRALKRSLDEMTADKILRRTVNNEYIVVYVLCKALTDADGDLVLERELKVIYRKLPVPGSPERLEYSSVQAESVLKPLIEKYQRSYTSGDITRYILLDTLKEAGAIALRPEGGMYFVPRTSADLVVKLRALMKELGEFTGASSSFLSAFNVIDDSATREDMQRHAKSSIKQEIATLLYRLEEMKERKVRPQTIANYLGDIERVGKEASLYHDLILLDAEVIKEQLGELRTAFAELLQGETPTSPFESRGERAKAAKPSVQARAWYEEEVAIA